MALPTGVRAGPLLLTATTLAILGCTPPTTDVAGTIKINGKPPKVSGIEICFQAADGRVFCASIAADGTYKMVDVPVGEARVNFVFVSPQVVPPTQAGKPKSRLVRPGAKGTAPKGPPQSAVKNPVPPRLRDFSTSALSYHVVSGSVNQFDYDMKP